MGVAMARVVVPAVAAAADQESLRTPAAHQFRIKVLPHSFRCRLRCAIRAPTASRHQVGAVERVERRSFGFCRRHTQ
eukprot:SAG31_NODE_20525_length_572_cov_0.801268_1_plen_77_part_00